MGSSPPAGSGRSSARSSCWWSTTRSLAASATGSDPRSGGVELGRAAFARQAWAQARAHLAAAAAPGAEDHISVVETAYGGGTSLYAWCPLPRRLRDVHAVTQHFLVRRDRLTTAGAVLAGKDVADPVF